MCWFLKIILALFFLNIKVRSELRDHSAMGKHFNLFIWTLLMKSTNEQYIFNDMDDRQQFSLNSAMHLIKSEIQQLKRSFEKMLIIKLEEIENNMLAKINTGIEDVTTDIIKNVTRILENKLACTSNETVISGKHCKYINTVLSSYCKSLIKAPL